MGLKVLVLLWNVSVSLFSLVNIHGGKHVQLHTQSFCFLRIYSRDFPGGPAVKMQQIPVWDPCKLAHTSVRKRGLPRLMGLHTLQLPHSPLPSNDYPTVSWGWSLLVWEAPISLTPPRGRGGRSWGLITSPPSQPSASPLKTKDLLGVPRPLQSDPSFPGPTHSTGNPVQNYLQNRGRTGSPGSPGSALATGLPHPYMRPAPGTAQLQVPKAGLHFPLPRDGNQPQRPPPHVHLPPRWSLWNGWGMASESRCSV